jgi:hypothetical protein
MNNYSTQISGNNNSNLLNEIAAQQQLLRQDGQVPMMMNVPNMSMPNMSMPNIPMQNDQTHGQGHGQSIPSHVMGQLNYPLRGDINTNDAYPNLLKQQNMIPQHMRARMQSQSQSNGNNAPTQSASEDIILMSEQQQPKPITLPTTSTLPNGSNTQNLENTNQQQNPNVNVNSNPNTNAQMMQLQQMMSKSKKSNQNTTTNNSNVKADTQNQNQTQTQTQTEKVPNYIVDPILIVLLYVIVTHPMTSTYLDKYIGALCTDGTITFKGVLVRGVLLVILYMVLKIVVSFVNHN